MKWWKKFVHRANRWLWAKRVRLDDHWRAWKHGWRVKRNPSMISNEITLKINNARHDRVVYRRAKNG